MIALGSTTDAEITTSSIVFKEKQLYNNVYPNRDVVMVYIPARPEDEFYLLPVEVEEILTSDQFANKYNEAWEEMGKNTGCADIRAFSRACSKNPLDRTAFDTFKKITGQDLVYDGFRFYIGDILGIANYDMSKRYFTLGTVIDNYYTICKNKKLDKLSLDEKIKKIYLVNVYTSFSAKRCENPFLKLVL